MTNLRFIHAKRWKEKVFKMTEEAAFKANLNSMKLSSDRNRAKYFQITSYTGKKHLREQLIAKNNPEAKEPDWATEKSKGETLP